jgi:uncharacterized protein (DUF302 family)
MEKSFAFQVILEKPYQKAIDLVGAKLKEEGFGVLTEIDVKTTLKEKLGEDVAPYAILGACNPPLAHKAIESDPLVGLMLPCNIVVREVEGGSEISIINPNAMLSMDVLAGNEAIQEVAADAAARLERVAIALRG